MKIYIAYKLNGGDFNELKKRLEKVSEIINSLGYETFVFVRDIQRWVPGGDPKAIMEKAMENMKKCDAIISIIESKEKGEGLLLESGYMKALGKKLIVASKPEGRAVLLKAMADFAFEFNDIEEFKSNLRDILNIINKEVQN